MTEHFIEVHSYIPCSRAEGPGLRFALWVQGCSIRCEGCANSHMWDRGKGQLMSVTDLLHVIEAANDIEGVTIVGGEPFDQAKPLALLARRVKERGLGVVVFTGYTYELLHHKSRPDHLALLKSTDLLIDGPFIKEMATLDLPWVGSSNQRYIRLTDRYAEFDLDRVKNCLEIRYDAENKKLVVNGMEQTSRVSRLIDRLIERDVISSTEERYV